MEEVDYCMEERVAKAKAEVKEVIMEEDHMMAHPNIVNSIIEMVTWNHIAEK